MNPPLIKWYNESNQTEITNWDAGVVDAGFYSRPEDPTQPDSSEFPSTFLIWNNRGGTENISDATNVKITTLSLVRYPDTGEIDPNQSYLPTGPVAGSDTERQAEVEVIFFDSTKLSNAGQWGTYNVSNQWVGWDPAQQKWGIYNQDGSFVGWAAPGAIGWRKIYGDNRCPVVVASGIVTRTTPAGGQETKYDILSGALNTGNAVTDKTNYSKIKMRLYVKPNASAGRVEFVVRVSYQYDT
jgi:hypothetical protein